MSFKKMNKGISILLLCCAMPMAVFAAANPLWDKLSSIAATGWMEVDSLSAKELKQLKSLSQSGDTNAQYALGMIYQAKHEHGKAAVWLKKAAAQGHVPARYSYNKNAAGHPDMAKLNW